MAALNPAGKIRQGLGLLLLGVIPLSGAAPDDLAARVVIFANSREAESVALARFYAAQRGIPPDNIVALPLPEAEGISWRQFVDEVYQPLQDELYHRGWIEGEASNLRDRVGRRRYAPTGHRLSYLVVCRGVPLRIYNDPTLIGEGPAKNYPRQLKKNEAAVDSELSLMAQGDYEITGYVPNPLFSNERPSALELGTVIKVSRLDGPTDESARRLVTSALAGERQGLVGRYYVDFRGPHPDGDRWLESTRAQLVALGFDGEVERTRATFAADARFDAPALYFGWYADNLNGPFATAAFAFPPGAVALHIHSFSARTLRSGSVGWCGPLVARGVTATVGNVFEPYLQLTHRPDLLLRALARGETFGDAVFYALPALSWESIALGDPLYRPFKVSLAEQEAGTIRLPLTLAPYVAIRRAGLLIRQSRPTEARAVLAEELKREPTLAGALSLAKLEREANDGMAVDRALGWVGSAQDFPPAEWPLAREAARLLVAQGSRPLALRIYSQLVRVEAPAAGAHLAVLAEAKEVADAGGDVQLAAEFARQLAALTPPAAK